MADALIGVAVGLTVGAAAAAVLVRRLARRSKPTAPDPRVLELSELAGGLAHEIRNPLSTLMVNLQLLNEELRGLGEADEIRRSLLKVDAVQQEARRLQHLLDDFLKLAGPCRLKAEETDLNTVVEELVEFFGPQAESHQVRLRVTRDPAPLLCRLDARLLKQALLNILLNAQEAMPDGGDVMIRTGSIEGQALPPDPRHPIASSPGAWATVEISDSGPGIPNEHVDRVLRPFYSTKAGGTGLGLSTTHRIVAEHGGRLSLHSEPGQGCSFLIHLPLTDQAARSR